tara:strand:- start:11871 stop:13610 length:1740 start_codon:yes stop_codon:yes gene_type:complete
MAGGNLSPRQKMINMMYLVLTALLALNVSKEVLNSFFEVNLGIVKSTEGLQKKNLDTYSDFENAANQEKVKNYKKLANQVKPESEFLVDFIQSMKYDLVLKSDGKVFLDSYKDENGDEIEENIREIDYSELSNDDKTKHIAHLEGKDKRNVSGDLFNPKNTVNGPNVNGDGMATQLRKKIDSFRKFLIGTLELAEDSTWISPGSADKLIQKLNDNLLIDDGKSFGEKNVTWEEYNFYDMPSVGALTLLSKWQADIKNMESEVISFFANNIDASSLKFSSAMATTIPSSNFVLVGDEFKSKIFLTAYDKTSNPEILIGDYDSLPDGTYQFKGDPVVVPVVNGQGMYTVKGKRVGPQTYKGLIKILQDDGDQYYPFEGEYIVANKSFAVSPTKMNVLYTVIDNPVTVSVAGYQPDQVSLSMNGGSIKTVSKKKGEYMVTPDNKMRGKNVSISVSVRGEDGKRKSIGKMDFRVKQVPDPKIFHLRSKKVSKEEIIGKPTLSAQMVDFEFDGIVFKVVKFDIECIGTVPKPFYAKKRIDSEVKQEIGRLKKGDKVIISNIVVKQKGGNTRDMGPSVGFNYTIK